MTLVINDRLDDGADGAAFAARGSLGLVAGVAGPNYVAPGYLGGAAVTYVTGSTSVVQVIEATSASSTTKYVDLLVKLSNACTTTGVVLTSRGTSDVARIVFSNTNFMRLTNGAGTTLQTGTTALPVGSWFRISLAVVANTATAKLYTDPTSASATDTLTGTVTGAAMTLNRFGNNNGLNLNGGTMQMDWPQVSNDAESGPRDLTLTGTATASPSSGTPPYTLTVVIAGSGGSGTYLYEILNWGDGTTAAQQSSGTFTKSIAGGASAGAKNVSYRITG